MSWNRWNRGWKGGWNGGWNNSWKSKKQWNSGTTHSQAVRDTWVAPATPSSSQAEPEDDSNYVLLGTLRGTVVGLQYYTGEVYFLYPRPR